MRNDQFAKHLEEEFAILVKIRENAHKEYAGTDVFENFNRRAEELGVTRKQALGVLMFKHIDTIKKFCAGEIGLENRESIDGRIRDAILYLYLLLGIVIEDRTRLGADVMKIKHVPSSGFANNIVQQAVNDR